MREGGREGTSQGPRRETATFRSLDHHPTMRIPVTLGWAIANYNNLAFTRKEILESLNTKWDSTSRKRKCKLSAHNWQRTFEEMISWERKKMSYTNKL